MAGVHLSVVQTSVLSAEVACWCWSAVRYDVIVSAVSTYTAAVILSILFCVFMVLLLLYCTACWLTLELCSWCCWRGTCYTYYVHAIL
jgi:hypothetical protein